MAHVMREPDVRSSATCFIDGRTVPAQARSRCPGSSLSNRLPTMIVWLSHGLRRPGTAGQERLKKGLLCSK